MYKSMDKLWVSSWCHLKHGVHDKHDGEAKSNWKLKMILIKKESRLNQNQQCQSWQIGVGQMIQKHSAKIDSNKISEFGWICFRRKVDFLTNWCSAWRQPAQQISPDLMELSAESKIEILISFLFKSNFILKKHLFYFILTNSLVPLMNEVIAFSIFSIVFVILTDESVRFAII
jgi:hypothetical protein